MEAIVGVWLSSLLGAGAFSTAGYILGQRGVVVPYLKLGSAGAVAGPAAATPVSEDDRITPNLAELDQSEGTGATKTHAVLEDLAARELLRARTEQGDANSVRVASLVDYDDEDRSISVRRVEGETAPKVVVTEGTETKQKETQKETQKDEAAAKDRAEVATARRDLQAALADLETVKASLDVAMARAQEATKAARSADTARAELEKQLEALRVELRREVVARASAEERATELGDRLAAASGETAGLRHKVAVFERQARQQRDGTSTRPPAVVERQRRRELEETEELRAKLREVYEKLERSSQPPVAPPSSPQPVIITGASSLTPTPTPGTATAAAGARPTPKLSDGTLVLREEIVRLTKENRALRARAIGSIPPSAALKAAAAAPELDMDSARVLIERLGGTSGIRGAALADEVGSMLFGAGEFADGLAAFGAYIRDASSRTERLLPVEGLDEIEIRDRKGMLLCTRVITVSAGALSLVFLGSSADTIVTAKKMADSGLRLGA